MLTIEAHELANSSLTPEQSRVLKIVEIGQIVAHNFVDVLGIAPEEAMGSYLPIMAAIDNLDHEQLSKAMGHINELANLLQHDAPDRINLGSFDAEPVDRHSLIDDTSNQVDHLIHNEGTDSLVIKPVTTVTEVPFGVEDTTIDTAINSASVANETNESTNDNHPAQPVAVEFNDASAKHIETDLPLGYKETLKTLKVILGDEAFNDLVTEALGLNRLRHILGELERKLLVEASSEKEKLSIQGHIIRIRQNLIDGWTKNEIAQKEGVTNGAIGHGFKHLGSFAARVLSVETRAEVLRAGFGSIPLTETIQTVLIEEPPLHRAEPKSVEDANQLTINYLTKRDVKALKLLFPPELIDDLLNERVHIDILAIPATIASALKAVDSRSYELDLQTLEKYITSNKTWSDISIEEDRSRSAARLRIRHLKTAMGRFTTEQLKDILSSKVGEGIDQSQDRSSVDGEVSMGNISTLDLVEINPTTDIEPLYSEIIMGSNLTKLGEFILKTVPGFEDGTAKRSEALKLLERLVDAWETAGYDSAMISMLSERYRNLVILGLNPQPLAEDVDTTREAYVTTLVNSIRATQHRLSF